MTKLVHVKGLAELQQALNQVPAKIEANILRAALRAGAKVVQEEVKAQVPVKSGTLRRGIKISTARRGGKVTAKVKATGKHAHIAPWLEYGTAAHRIVAKGKGLALFGGGFAKVVQHPGLPPRPFMRPALDARAAQAVLATGNAIKKRLATKHGLDTPDLELETDE